MAPEVSVEPTYDDGHGGVSSRGSKEECAIVDGVAHVGDEKNDETDHGDDDACNSEEETMGKVVGDSGDSHGEDKSYGPGWRGEEVCSYGCVSQL